MSADDFRALSQALGPHRDLQAWIPARRLWSELQSVRRVRDALAPPPQDSGPLNSQALLARALAELSRESPAYLTALLDQVAALGEIQSLEASAAPTVRKRS